MAFSCGFSRGIHRHMVFETSIYLRATSRLPTQLQTHPQCRHVLLEAAQWLVRYLNHDSVYQVASFLRYHRATLHTKRLLVAIDVFVRAPPVKSGILGRMCSDSHSIAKCSPIIYSRVPNYLSCVLEHAVTKLRWHRV